MASAVIRRRYEWDPGPGTWTWRAAGAKGRQSATQFAGEEIVSCLRCYLSLSQWLSVAQHGLFIGVSSSIRASDFSVVALIRCRPCTESFQITVHESVYSFQARLGEIWGASNARVSTLISASPSWNLNEPNHCVFKKKKSNKRAECLSFLACRKSHISYAHDVTLFLCFEKQALHICS